MSQLFLNNNILFHIYFYCINCMLERGELWIHMVLKTYNRSHSWLSEETCFETRLSLKVRLAQSKGYQALLPTSKARPLTIHLSDLLRCGFILQATLALAGSTDGRCESPFSGVGSKLRDALRSCPYCIPSSTVLPGAPLFLFKIHLLFINCELRSGRIWTITLLKNNGSSIILYFTLHSRLDNK